MIEQLRRFLTTNGGKVLGTLLSLGIVVFAVYMVISFIKGDTPDTAFVTTYVCSDTGKSFSHVNKVGETIPIVSPFSGKNTGYPAEACYWTKDGGIKTEPTWVLLNSQVHKPGPTFCPDCGRLVIERNPRAQAGRPPPPTEADWLASHPSEK